MRSSLSLSLFLFLSIVKEIVEYSIDPWIIRYDWLVYNNEANCIIITITTACRCIDEGITRAKVSFHFFEAEPCVIRWPTRNHRFEIPNPRIIRKGGLPVSIRGERGCWISSLPDRISAFHERQWPALETDKPAIVPFVLPYGRIPRLIALWKPSIRIRDQGISRDFIRRKSMSRTRPARSPSILSSASLHLLHLCSSNGRRERGGWF